jgi:hypothetical protein
VELNRLCEQLGHTTSSIEQKPGPSSAAISRTTTTRHSGRWLSSAESVSPTRLAQRAPFGGQFQSRRDAWTVREAAGGRRLRRNIPEASPLDGTIGDQPRVGVGGISAARSAQFAVDGRSQASVERCCVA